MTRAQGRTGTLALTLGATGVVFGDIGTSPLYAFKESFATSGRDLDDVFGLVSLIFWALMIVVTIKYLLIVMRADNHGEGGILSLLALMPRRIRESSTGRERLLFLLVLVGTALLFGDGVLTPAISVLSATEGLELVRPGLGAYAVEIAVVILVLLFSVQSRGTHRIGQFFGPVMVLWFLVIAALGVFRLAARPDALLALSPSYAFGYIASHGWVSLAVASSVILAVTGAEALYADMGHFGRRPIRLSWALLVGPALVLCYLGQAALVLENPEMAENPFFGLAPDGGTLPLVILATAATVVASQALITGVFSLARQGIQLGVLPRLSIKHTHADHEGQIYVPFVNVTVGALCIAVVVAFQSSSALAHAYVLVIAGTMFITTIAFHAVASRTWGWPGYRLWPFTTLFLVVDFTFLVGTLSNLLRGGWVPVAFGAVVMLVMIGWSNGYRALNNYMARTAVHWPSIAEELKHGSITRVPGVGVYLASPAEDVPAALSSQIKVLHAMPAEVLVVTVRTVSIPVADGPPEIIDVMKGVRRIVIPVGYMETPDIPAALRSSVLGKVESVATYYLSERKFAGTDAGSVPEHREKFFAFLHRNSQAPSQFFGLPSDRVIAIGTRIDL
ncbi:potassium transporter Kup [Longivirga aurantiaca]|uniref:Probable potassium transport system protein Kup n=1 Tax=Longivirga aurantiaca TaxID=1837743 RepID=A0ABW1SX82_9ACTN